MSLLSSILGKKGPKDMGAKIPGIPDDFAAVVARLQGREPSKDERLRLADGVTLAQFLPISTKILAQPPEPPKPAKADPRDLQCGDAVDLEGVKIENYDPEKDLDRCGGIYLGTEERINGETKLKEIWDIYAAPQDFKKPDGGNLLMTFNNAVKHVAGLRNYHGHDAGNFANETALSAARDNGTYDGGWFLPTKELLHGKTSGGDKIQPANLYDSRESGAFKNTFMMKSGSGLAHWYWSLTEPPDDPSDVYVVDFSGGGDDWDHKDNHELSSRVVRAELRP